MYSIVLLKALVERGVVYCKIEILTYYTQHTREVCSVRSDKIGLAIYIRRQLA
jgi:hypothetical protein